MPIVKRVNYCYLFRTIISLCYFIHNVILFTVINYLCAMNAFNSKNNRYKSYNIREN